MHPEIAKRFEGIEQRRKALVARVKALPPDKQNQKPDPKSFSPAEVIMHMALAEASNVGFMKKHPPRTLKGKKPRMTFIFRKTVSSMQNPIKLLATVPYMVPKGTVILAEADKAWAEVRKETAGFLEQVNGPNEPFIKFLFIFGLGSASDYLTLMEAHLTYHESRFSNA